MPETDGTALRGGIYGTVLRYFPYVGYGFIESKEGVEVYFKTDNFAHPAFEKLDIGREARFLGVEGDGGMKRSYRYFLR